MGHKRILLPLLLLHIPSLHTHIPCCINNFPPHSLIFLVSSPCPLLSKAALSTSIQHPDAQVEELLVESLTMLFNHSLI
jgi:hypothetical protein